MARAFSGSGQYLLGTASLVTAYPFSIAAWVKQASSTGNQYIVTLGVTGTNATDELYLFGGQVTAETDNAGGAAASASGSVSTGVWAHACGVWAATNDRRAYRDGANKGTSSGSKSVQTHSNVAIGFDNIASPGEYFNGSIAEVGIWNIALTDADVAALALGVSPLMVRPDALVAYWPILGAYSPEIDLIGRVDLTVTGATADTHPRIYVPRGTLINGKLNVYTISGTTKDNTGAALAGCTVKLYRTRDDVEVQSTTSDGSGAYSFTVHDQLAYYIVAYKAGTPDVAGTTVNTILGT